MNQKAKLYLEQIDDCEVQVAKEFSQFQTPSAKLEFLYQEIEKGFISSQLNALRGFFLILSAITSCRAHFAKKPHELEKLQNLAEKLLALANIQPTTSTHSHLYSKLYLEIAQYKLERGEVWESIADQMIGEYLGRNSKSQDQFQHLELYAQQAYQLGHLRRARTALLFLDIKKPNGSLQESQILLIRICRLGGDIAEALALIQTLQKSLDGKDPFFARLELQKALIELVETGDVKGLTQTVNTHNKVLSASERDLAKLWHFAGRQKESWKGLVKKRNSPKRDAETAEKEQYLEGFLEVMEQNYDLELSLERRLRQLSSALATIRQCQDPEWSLAFMAAAIRWLYRSRQNSFASAIIEEYHNISFAYTQGKTTDVFQLLIDISSNLPIVDDPEIVGGEFGQISSSLVGRFFKIARVISKSGLSIAISHLRSDSPEKMKEIRQTIESNFLRELEQTMGDIKGPFMKVGQLLASSGHLREETREKMQAVIDRAPPIPLKDFDYVFEGASAPLREKLLPRLSVRPIAVASLGQVHRGFLDDGSEVAVKLMYPKAEIIVSQDLKMMKILKPALRKIIHDEKLEGILEDFRDRFLDECDYIKEAARQAEIRQIFQDVPGIYVPKVYPELSSRHVLVSEFIRGERLDVFLDNASKERRNAIARNMMRFFFTCSLKHNLVQLDPNISNFIVRDDELVVIDFGAIRTISQELAERHRSNLIARYTDNLPVLHQNTLVSMGIKGSTLSLENFEKELEPNYMPFLRKDVVRPAFYPDERNFIEQVIHRGYSTSYQGNANEFQVELIVALYFELFSRMGAELNWRRELGQLFADLGIDADSYFGMKKSS